MRAIPAILAFGLLAGCETRIVRQDSALLGLPGSVSSMERKVENPNVLLPVVADGETIVENPDGSRAARSTNVRQLIDNMARCLDAEWGEKVFVKDLLSAKAKSDMAGDGMTPAQAFRQMKAQRDDVIRLFNLMPLGEYTPGFFLKNTGPGMFRLIVPGRGSENLPYRGIDVVYEKGNYRFYWFVPQEPR